MSDDELYRVYVITYTRVMSKGVVNLTDQLSMSMPEAMHSLRAQVAMAIAAQDASLGSGLLGKVDLVERVRELTAG
jgi:hypothetical protein